MIKPLKILLNIFSFIIISCSGIPQKPEIEIGILDVPAGEVITGTTNGGNVRSVSELDYKKVKSLIELSPNVRRVPIIEYDKAVCEKPTEYEKLKNYLDALERYIYEQCQ